MNTLTPRLDDIDARLVELAVLKLTHGYRGVDTEREIGRLLRTRRMMLDDPDYEVSFWHNGQRFWI